MALPHRHVFHVFSRLSSASSDRPLALISLIFQITLNYRFIAFPKKSMATLANFNLQALVLSPPKLPTPRSFGRSLPSIRVSKAMGLSSSVARSSSSYTVAEFDASTVDALGDVSILAASSGEPVLFRDLWDQNEGIAVVALLRHFGCFCCWELASVLKETKPQFDAAGVKLIAVGVGSPDKARLLAERLPFPLDSLYADPDRKAYDLLGLYYGLTRTFLNPASTKVFSRFESLKKAMKNYTIDATPYDKSGVLQQGGMLVFKGTQLLYARKDEGTGICSAGSARACFISLVQAPFD